VQAHLHAGQRAGQCQVVEVAEVADAEDLPGELGESCAERHVEALEDDAAQGVGVVALGNEDGGERAGVLALVQAEQLEAPLADRGTGGGGVPLVPREDLGQALGVEQVERHVQPYSRLVAGVYGQKPFALAARIGCQSQNDLGSRADAEASRALALTALKLRPGGSISPFCEPATVTSTRHSSWR
jgi:hypothetical protein